MAEPRRVAPPSPGSRVGTASSAQPVRQAGRPFPPYQLGVSAVLDTKLVARGPAG